MVTVMWGGDTSGHGDQNLRISEMLTQIKEKSAFSFSDWSIFKVLFYIFNLETSCDL